jgi:hypothetical protein
VVDNEPTIARNFTWAVLGTEDGHFWHLGGVTRWNSQFFIHTWTFLSIIYVASQLFLCLFWISLWLRIGVYNTFASKICVKLLKPPEFRFQRLDFLLDLLTHSWFHSMLFSLPSYQFPYIVMNRCLYLMAVQVERPWDWVTKLFVESPKKRAKNSQWNTGIGAFSRA